MTLDTAPAFTSGPGQNVAYPSMSMSIPTGSEPGEIAGANDWADRVDSFQELQDGWDGYRAPRPSEQAVARALMLVRALGNSPSAIDGCTVEISPFLDGGVEISIGHDSGRWLDLTIQNDRTMSAERSDEAGARARVMDLERHLHWLLRG